MSVSGEVSRVAGQPATVRVGRVVSMNPFLVDVQGTVFDEVGLSGATPPVGASVLLLGQAVKGSASSGSSWAMLGQTFSSASTDSPWEYYTVSWTSAANPQPVLGNGRLFGRWMSIGIRTILVQIGLVFGSTTSAGNGRWFFSAPLMSNEDSRLSATGAAYILDAGTANRTGVVNLGTPPNILFVTASPNGDVGSATPQVWANGDELRMNITYEHTM